MRDHGNREPKRGSKVWLIAVIAVALAVRVDSIVADIVLLTFTIYSVWSDYNSRS